MNRTVAIYSNYSQRENSVMEPQCTHWEVSKYNDQNPVEEVIGSFFNEYVSFQSGMMQDFNIKATLEEYPQEADDAVEVAVSDEEARRQVEEIVCRRFVRSVRNQIKKASDPNGKSLNEEKIPSEDTDTYTVKVVWDKPYQLPTSVLKKTNGSVAVVEKQAKKVRITIPATHISGYHPVRTPGGAVYLRDRCRKHSMKQIRQNAVQYLFDAVLAEMSYNFMGVKPKCPLDAIVNCPDSIVDFVVIVNDGPDDFFVRVGRLEIRRRFNYMETQMREWYSQKRGLMEYCATSLQDAEYLGFYVMFHQRFDEYVRVQISSQVVRDRKKNPKEIVVVALIDYGGHVYSRVSQLLPLMPYFAIFPKMAFRGVLNLTKDLGRAEYTNNEQKVFQNLIADYNGIVEAYASKPEDTDAIKKFDDNGTFSIVELVLFVMSNGKRKNVDEIILGSEEEHNVYLREPSHYPSVDEVLDEKL